MRKTLGDFWKGTLWFGKGNGLVSKINKLQIL